MKLNPCQRLVRSFAARCGLFIVSQDHLDGWRGRAASDLALHFQDHNRSPALANYSAGHHAALCEVLSHIRSINQRPITTPNPITGPDQ